MKLTIRGVPIEDVTVEEAAELIAKLGGLIAVDSPAAPPPAASERFDSHSGATNGPAAQLDSRGRVLMGPPPGAPKIPTANKREALLRFFEGIQIVDHKKMLRLLAAAGAAGLDQDQLRKKAGVSWLPGFTNSITKRTRAYGLNKADVLIVEQRGTLATKRIQIYRLTSAMLDVMRENNLIEEG